MYDNLGRIVEVGVLHAASALTETTARTPALFESWLTAGVKHQITKTFYDEAVYSFTGFAQDNLRNRVSSILYMDSYDTINYQSASHFSYDISGNVKTLLQENNHFWGPLANLSLKRIDYDYDLISGKVNYVYYQRDSVDQFTHHYEYDDDNRLTHVSTSRDNLTWEEDAHYLYYMHGPLARVELGENKVQGIDYAYTLQGWIKGINSGQLDPSIDMGADGQDQSTGINPVSRDAYGYNLGYFNQDYQPIGSSNFEANYNPTGGSGFGNDSYQYLSTMDDGLYWH